MNTDELKELLNELKELKTTLNENIWGYADFPGRTDVSIYNGHKIALDQEFLDDYKNSIDNLSDQLFSIEERLKYEENDYHLVIDNIKNLNSILNQFEFNESIVDLFNFDQTEYARDKMDENSIEINEDTLNDYAEKYSQEAFEIKDELASNAKEDLLKLETTTEQLIQGWENILDELDTINI